MKKAILALLAMLMVFTSITFNVAAKEEDASLNKESAETFSRFSGTLESGEGKTFIIVSNGTSMYHDSKHIAMNNNLQLTAVDLVTTEGNPDTVTINPSDFAMLKLVKDSNDYFLMILDGSNDKYLSLDSNNRVVIGDSSNKKTIALSEASGNLVVCIDGSSSSNRISFSGKNNYFYTDKYGDVSLFELNESGEEIEVTFNYNYENCPKNQTVKQIGSKTYNMPDDFDKVCEDRLKDGYVFAGWKTSTGYVFKKGYFVDTTKYDGENYTVTAQWLKQEKYALVTDADNKAINLSDLVGETLIVTDRYKYYEGGNTFAFGKDTKGVKLTPGTNEKQRITISNADELEKIAKFEIVKVEEKHQFTPPTYKYYLKLINENANDVDLYLSYEDISSEWPVVLAETGTQIDSYEKYTESALDYYSQSLKLKPTGVTANNGYIAYEHSSEGYGWSANTPNPADYYACLYRLIKDSYNVTFNYCDDKTEADIISEVNGKDFVYPEVPTRIGYQFGGWYTKEEGGEKYEEKTVDLIEDINLYAHWVKVDAYLLVDCVVDGGEYIVANVNSSGKTQVMTSDLGVADEKDAIVKDNIIMITEDSDVAKFVAHDLKVENKYDAFQLQSVSDNTKYLNTDSSTVAIKNKGSKSLFIGIRSYLHEPTIVEYELRSNQPFASNPQVWYDGAQWKVSGLANGNEARLYKKVNEHKHGDWKYSVSKDGNYIIATCGKTDCIVPEGFNLGISLKTPEKAIYTGKPQHAEFIYREGETKDDWYNNVGKTPDIVYYNKNDLTKPVSPVDAGTYIAKITLGEVSIQKEFTIEKASQPIEHVIMNSYVYGDGKNPDHTGLRFATPKLEGEVQEKAKVTYYYQKLPKTDQWVILPWNFNSRSLDIGLYHVYAIISETKNYKETVVYEGNTSTFDVYPAYVEVSKFTTPLTYTGRSQTLFDSRYLNNICSFAGDKLTQTNAKEYSSILTLNGNYRWTLPEELPESIVVDEHNPNKITINWEIEAKKITVPTARDNLVYNTRSQKAFVDNNIDNLIRAGIVSATTSYESQREYRGYEGTDAGSYQTKLKINNTNYVWDALEGDTATISWKIARREIKLQEVTVSPKSFIYNGYEQLPNVSIRTKDGLTLRNRYDYQTKAYDENGNTDIINAGKKYIEIELINKNYYFELTSSETSNKDSRDTIYDVDYEIVKAQAKVTLDKNLFIYNGDVQKPKETVTVLDGGLRGTKLDKRAYTLTYANVIPGNPDKSIDAGDKTVTISLNENGNYSRNFYFLLDIDQVPAITLDYKIIPAQVELKIDTDTFIYNGDVQKPRETVTVLDGGLRGQILRRDAYTLTYANVIPGSEDKSIDAGDKTVTVALNKIGNYANNFDFIVSKEPVDAKTLGYKILPATLTASIIQDSFIYDGKEHKPVPTVTITSGSKKGTKLNPAAYELTYLNVIPGIEDVTNAGDKTVTISLYDKAARNYDFIVSREPVDAITLGYKIEKRALKVSLEENSKVYDGYKFTPGVTFENLVPGEELKPADKLDFSTMTYNNDYIVFYVEDNFTATNKHEDKAFDATFPTATKKLAQVTLNENSKVANNYYLIDANKLGSVNLPYEITKAPLTITINDAKMYKGKKLPTFTSEIEGLIENDEISFNLIPDGNTAKKGTYPIIIEEGSLNIMNTNYPDDYNNPYDVTDSYDVTVIPGTLTVKNRPNNDDVKVVATGIE